MKNIKDVNKNIKDIYKNKREINKNIKEIFLIIIGFFLNMRFGRAPTKISIKCYSRLQS